MNELSGRTWAIGSFTVWVPTKSIWAPMAMTENVNHMCPGNSSHFLHISSSTYLEKTVFFFRSPLFQDATIGQKPMTYTAITFGPCVSQAPWVGILQRNPQPQALSPSPVSDKRSIIASCPGGTQRSLFWESISIKATQLSASHNRRHGYPMSQPSNDTTEETQSVKVLWKFPHLANQGTSPRPRLMPTGAAKLGHLFFILQVYSAEQYQIFSN